MTAATTSMSQPLTKATAKRLRMILAGECVSASALARAAGMPQPSISRRMLGKTDFSLGEIERICEVSGISAPYLVFGIGEPISEPEKMESLCAIRDSNPEPADYPYAHVIELSTYRKWREQRREAAATPAGERHLQAVV